MFDGFTAISMIFGIDNLKLGSSQSPRLAQQKILMAEVTHASEDHGHVRFICSGNDFFITN